MAEKLCVFCKHFSYREIGVYSVDTFETFGGFNCEKKHYDDVRPEDTDKFRELILKAEQCGDYCRPEEENSES